VAPAMCTTKHDTLITTRRHLFLLLVRRGTNAFSTDIGQGPPLALPFQTCTYIAKCLFCLDLPQHASHRDSEVSRIPLRIGIDEQHCNDEQVESPAVCIRFFEIFLNCSSIKITYQTPTSRNRTARFEKCCKRSSQRNGDGKCCSGFVKIHQVPTSRATTGSYFFLRVECDSSSPIIVQQRK